MVQVYVSPLTDWVFFSVVQAFPAILLGVGVGVGDGEADADPELLLTEPAADMDPEPQPASKIISDPMAVIPSALSRKERERLPPKIECFPARESCVSNVLPP
ncbi:hypothetical protein VUN82_06145 [Micrococcaceae bacterium Sec5.1]